MNFLDKKSAASIAVAAVILSLTVEIVPEIRGLIICGALLFLLINRCESGEKALLFSVAVLGLSPLVGWIGTVNASIDVVVILSAVTISHSAMNLVQHKKFFNLSVLPAALAGVVTYFWWRPILAGQRVDLLARLMGGWDHFGHYYLFISAKVYNSFVSTMQDSLPNTTLYGRKYPAGIHMSWAQWWRDMDRDVLHQPSVALHQYFQSVVITVAICTILIVISVSRVVENYRSQILVSIGFSVLFVPLIGFGHLSMAIWSGFPNFIVGITGVIIIGSIAMRPSESVWMNLFVIAGASAMASYNWYPLLVPIVPFALFTLWKQFCRLEKKDKSFFFVVMSILGVFVAIPVIQSLSFGAKHLAVPGGINNLPAQGIVMLLLFGSALGLIQISRNSSWQGVMKASPLLLTGAFQLLVTVPIRLNDGTYPYYPQKIAYGMVFIVIAVSCMTIIQSLERHWNREALKTKLIQGTAFLIICAALSQQFGYVGVDWQVLAPGNTAPGLQVRNQLTLAAKSKHRISSILLGLEQATGRTPQVTRDCLVLDDTEMQEYDPVLVNYWVGTLTWSLTEEHLVRSQQLVPIRTGQADAKINADVINKIMRPSVDCPVVTLPVARALIELNPRWTERTWVIESDGNITKLIERS
jgi:hypothetical protein